MTTLLDLDCEDLSQEAYRLEHEAQLHHKNGETQKAQALAREAIDLYISSEKLTQAQLLAEKFGFEDKIIECSLRQGIFANIVREISEKGPNAYKKEREAYHPEKYAEIAERIGFPLEATAHYLLAENFAKAREQSKQIPLGTARKMYIALINIQKEMNNTPVAEQLTTDLESILQSRRI